MKRSPPGRDERRPAPRNPEPRGGGDVVRIFGYHSVVAALQARRANLHVVVTGRNAKPELIDAADLVTEMGAAKHHFAAGVKAQAGIEF